MKDIKEYIDESIFSGNVDIVKNTENVLKQEAIDELAKYIYQYRELKRLGVRLDLDSKGYVITCPSNVSGVSIFKFPEKGLKYKISQFVGDKARCLDLRSSGCVDLTTVFTPDCEFDSRLSINCCDCLTSLEGCPKKVRVFECQHNRLLNSIEGAPRECKFFYWAYNGRHSKEKPKKDMEPTIENVQKYLKSKSVIINIEY
jgi:hypothetical protein